VIGEKGSLFINRYTAPTVDLPELMLFKDGKTTPVPVEGVERQAGFIAAGRDFIEKLNTGGQPGRMAPPAKPSYSSPWQLCRPLRPASK
jgi:hypothetical protein